MVYCDNSGFPPPMTRNYHDCWNTVEISGNHKYNTKVIKYSKEDRHEGRKSWQSLMHTKNVYYKDGLVSVSGV